MAQSLGWGIVGPGRIADTQVAPAITALEGNELAGVVSREQGRAEAFAKRHGARVALDDYAALLADPAVGAVYIATPNALHAEQVIAAARAGKHVLCDKPLATTVADAERAVAACRDAGVHLGIMFQTRSHEGMAEIRQAIAGQEIGRVLIAQVEMSAGRTLLSGWRTDPGLAGIGTVNNIGVHGYDLLRFLLGSEIAEVSAMLGSEAGLALDTTALALLSFANGALAYVNANQSVPGYQADLVIYGTEGRITGRNVTRPDREGSIAITAGGTTRELAVSSAGAYRATIRDFTEAVLAGRAPSPSGLDGLRSVQVTDALAESWRTRRTVAVPAGEDVTAHRA